jgi:mono/diheme cytochrome c family protein
VSPAGGEKIFKQYCTACHRPAPFDAKLVGPPLKDITKQRSEEWLIKWIRNNGALRAAGDKDAIAIWTEYGKNEMPSFLSFSDDENQIYSRLHFKSTGTCCITTYSNRTFWCSGSVE